MDDMHVLVFNHQLATVKLVCIALAFVTYHQLHRRNRVNFPTRDLMLHRERVRGEMLRSLSVNGKCRELIRMSERAFMLLCQKLEIYGGLRPTQRMSIEEQVFRFLHMVGNDMRNRLVSWMYRRSGSTRNRHFHRALNAILSLEDHYLQQPTGDIVPKEIKEKRRFYPFFKDCIGTIDGTHIRVRVPSKDAPRYCSRKGCPTNNALVACTFDLKLCS